MPAKQNYQQQLENIIKEISLSGKKPSLLLHACCGPCSSYVMEYLAGIFNITIYYYNPNIHPKAEYDRRLAELKKFVSSFPPAIQTGISVVEDVYNPEDFFEATNVRNQIELQTESEKGERCRRCYLFRMKRAWNYASNHNFDFFTTTLSISPHKDSEKINTIGQAFISENSLKYLPADFKKKNGYLRSLQLSKEYGLYRQDYCGCVYSQQQTH
ncbi:MAG TPA: recombinase [Treponema sp.]|nr:recombinase [Treponema sp.]